MHFTNPEPALNKTELIRIEQSLGINLPQTVRLAYLCSNGGCPCPYVFEDDKIDTVIAEFLPLKSINKKTAIDSYKQLVLKKELVPRHFFPFAVDGGGDYFFVDCSAQEGPVYFYRSDSAVNNRIIKLDFDFDGFWKSLKSEN